MESPEWHVLEFRFDLEVKGALDDFEQENYMLKTIYSKHEFGIHGQDGAMQGGTGVREVTGSYGNNQGVR